MKSCPRPALLSYLCFINKWVKEQTIPWDLSLRTKPKARGWKNKLHTIPELGPAGEADREPLGQGGQRARSLHQTCLNASTYSVNNACTEKNSGLRRLGEGCREWARAWKCSWESKELLYGIVSHSCSCEDEWGQRKDPKTRIRRPEQGGQ